MNREELTAVIVAATQARNDVRTYAKKNKISPKVKIPSVLAFQKLDSKLTADSLWGPNSVEAAKFYLSQMTDNEVPTFHPAFKSTKITWQKPTIEKEKVEETAVKAEPKKKATKVKAKPKKVNKSVDNALANLSKLDASAINKALAKKTVKVKTDKHGQDPILATNSIDAEEEIVDNIVAQNGLTKADVKAIIKDALKNNASDKEIIQLLTAIKKELLEHRGIVENKGGKISGKDNLRLMGVVLN